MIIDLIVAPLRLIPLYYSFNASTSLHRDFSTLPCPALRQDPPTLLPKNTLYIMRVAQWNLWGGNWGNWIGGNC